MILNSLLFIENQKRGFLILTLVLLSFLTIQPSTAQEVAKQINVQNHEIHWVRDYALMLKTPTGLTTIDVLQRNEDFRKFDMGQIEIDPDGAIDYWFLFRIESDISPLFLSLPHLFFAEIELFKIVDNQALLVSKGGSDIFDELKYLKYPGELFDLELQRGESATYLLKLNRVLYKTFSARVFSGRKLISLQQKSFTAEGILLGIILGVIIYHFLIYIRLKEREYLLLSIYMLFLIALIASISGATYGVLTFPDPKWHYKSFNIIGPLTSIFSLWFSIVFLEIHKGKNPGFWKIYMVFQALYIFAVICSLFSVPIFERTSYFLSAPTSIFLLYLGFRRYKEGFKPAAIYLAAYIPASISVIILTLYIYGLLEYYWVIHNSLLIGVVLQAVFFSLAVATKIRILKDEKESILKAENINLEDKVRMRTRDLEKSLNDLKAMQKQLIQSEKMASLGELTAGIAHEIQNPLNFVNNFSELNKELFEELKEVIGTGDIEEIKLIVSDIELNDSKINEHGKRAETIVKGMLAHSRGNSGEKEVTNLNSLVDECVRLAYHRLHAKDKTFNAEYKIELDYSLPKVNIIASDIGRVLLNLMNNAFYATAERSRSTAKDGKPDYMPLVIVSTKNLNQHVEIRVQDNGNGIPDSIKEKIFQPFFTTKPTGSGTGLGLSLSYDIVTAHGGEISVQSTEGNGTELIVTLPI